MGFLELSEEEEKYFNSQGAEEEIKAAETKEEESEEEERTNVANDESSEVAETQRADSTANEADIDEESAGEKEGADGAYAGQSEDGAAEQSNTEKSPERDFKKAYGIAEQKRLELSRKIEEQNRQTEALKHQLDTLMQFVKPQSQEPETKAPNKDEDPIGYYSHQMETLNKTVAEQQKYLKQQSEQQLQAQKVNDFVAKYRKSGQEFAEQQADFADAYKFLEQARLQEYQAMGYSQEESVRFLREDEMALAVKAYQDGVNPGERLYAAAKARGFALQNKPSKLDAVERGLKNSKTLSSSKSKQIKQALDLNDIDNMNEKEFDKYFAEVEREQKRAGNYRPD